MKVAAVPTFGTPSLYPPGFMTRLINPQDFSHAAGHERYSGMSKVYYKYAHGALIVFDLARPETFESALRWLSDFSLSFPKNVEFKCL